MERAPHTFYFLSTVGHLQAGDWDPTGYNSNDTSDVYVHLRRADHVGISKDEDGWAYGSVHGQLGIDTPREFVMLIC